MRPHAVEVFRIPFKSGGSNRYVYYWCIDNCRTPDKVISQVFTTQKKALDYKKEHKYEFDKDAYLQRSFLWTIHS